MRGPAFCAAAVGVTLDLVCLRVVVAMADGLVACV